LSSEVELKKAKATEFVASKEFGLATWSSLFIIRRSVYTMVNAIKAESAFVKQLEAFQSDLPKEPLEKEELRDFMQLDVIGKLMMLIETVYALSDALSTSKCDVPGKMAFYGPGIVLRFLQRVERNDGKAILARVLALPNSTDLPIEDNERIALAHLSVKTCETFLESLRDWAHFYANHSTIYNKLKHGLSLSTALHVKDENGVEVKDFSLSFAYDRVGKRSIPPNSLFVSGQLFEGKWFDTVNIVPFSENNLTLYIKIASEIDEWTGYIIDNQMTWAENCGKVYLPGRLSLQEKSYRVSYRCKESGDVLVDLRSVFQKIVKQMYINSNRSNLMTFMFSTDKSVPKLLSVLNTWHSATISISPQHKTAPPVVSELRQFDVKSPESVLP
jgi:hypothetical protein